MISTVAQHLNAGRRGVTITRADLDGFVDLLPAVEPHIPPSIAARRAARAGNADRVASVKARQRIAYSNTIGLAS